MDKLNNISFVEERILYTVCVVRDQKDSLGLQVTEGSDGNVYIQSVIVGGPAHLTGNILSGDQVIAVDDKNLLGMKYKDALNLLKNTGHKVEFILSRMVQNRGGGANNIHSQTTLKISENVRCKTNLCNELHLKNLRLENKMNKIKHLSYPTTTNYYTNNKDSKSPIEKHLIESCHDISNLHKYYQNNSTEVPYHKHIRYEIEQENDCMSKKQLPITAGSAAAAGTTTGKENNLNRNLSKSCTQIFINNNNNTNNEQQNDNKALIVDCIPKIDVKNFRSLDRHLIKNNKESNNNNTNMHTIPPIALPRSLGLSRKWRGPVRYPVTPIKKNIDCNDYLSTSDEEQVFI